ncbi:haloacid dehalogenase type II [Polyangium spumosum]|uniref:haloacid dehalogenase type II n=1 Tax=Polyangium spumosum TaxID=889282 RepID=UPI0030840CAB
MSLRWDVLPPITCEVFMPTLPSNRRRFLQLLTSAPLGVAASCVAAAPEAPARPPARARVRAIAFDAFPIFDPRPIGALAEELFPGQGASLMDAWRTRQFEYTWLRVASQRYADFWQVTADALSFAATRLGLDLDARTRTRLLEAHLELRAWPDVLPALRSLRGAGVRLVFLSNFTPRMLDAAITSAGLGGLFERAISTDEARTYKPDPRAYRLAVDALELPREAIVFAAFAGWDAAGAKWFGYPTFWVNRMKQPAEMLDVLPDGIGAGLSELVTFAAAGA